MIRSRKFIIEYRPAQISSSPSVPVPAAGSAVWLGWRTAASWAGRIGWVPALGSALEVTGVTARSEVVTEVTGWPASIGLGLGSDISISPEAHRKAGGDSLAPAGQRL